MVEEEQARKATLEYFKGDELAAQVWLSKYALRNDQGQLLESSPFNAHLRIAQELNFVEKHVFKARNSYFPQFMSLLHEFKHFIPAGSPMYGIGNYYQNVSLGNCFVIGNTADSYGGIMKLDEQMVQIMKRRGGVGIDLSHLRAKGTKVSNAAKTTSGLVSFIKRYTNSTAEVAQDGRRGALMISCDVNHPDIIDFIDCKKDLNQYNSANLSVRIDNQFMQSVIQDKDKSNKESLILKRIANNMWKSAEPGILFWSKIIEESPADCYDGFQTTSTNPCGELPLCPYDSCRLGHMNLFSYVHHPFLKTAIFDYETFAKDVYMAQRMMDNIIELELMKIADIIDKIHRDPEPYEMKVTELKLWMDIFAKTYLGRRTGLGVTAMGDTLAALGLTYGCENATKVATNIMRVFAGVSYNASVDLAKERGTFPLYNHAKEQFNPFIRRLIHTNAAFNSERYFKYGRRNIANLTIAPTGSVSCLTQTSSGIEPVFALEYKRTKRNGDATEEYDVKHPKYQLYLNICDDPGIDDSLKIESPYKNACTHEISVQEKIVMQGKIQQWIDHSISVTHNVAKDFPKEKVLELIVFAYMNRCKGFTLYRDGSREGVLNTKSNQHVSFEPIDAVKRPKELDCDIHISNIKGKKWIVLIGLLNQKPYEVFAFPYTDLGLQEYKGKIIKIKPGVYNLETTNIVVEDIVRLFDRPEEEFATRLISANLRHRTDLRFIFEQLNKAPGNITDFSRVIARILKKYIKEAELKPKEICECGGSFEYQGGCLICKSCGYSKCD